MKELNQLYAVLQNLLSTTKWRGAVMRFLLLQQTDTEDVRHLLNRCITESKYNKDHKRLAKELNKLYPLENWSERSLSHLLLESAQISISRANQIMEVLFPVDKTELTIDQLERVVTEMRDLLDQFAIEERKALSDKTIAPEEMELFKIRATQVHNLFQKFLTMCNAHINVELS